jgi:hypothetical protein
MDKVYFCGFDAKGNPVPETITEDEWLFQFHVLYNRKVDRTGKITIHEVTNEQQSETE